MTADFNRRKFLFGAAGALAVVTASKQGVAIAESSPKITRLKPAYGPAAGIAKLNANENPYGPSEAALAAIQEASASGAYYVNESARALQAMIAERHGVDPEYVALSSGSSGALVACAVSAGQSGNILGPDLFWDTTSKSVEKQGIAEITRLPKTPGLEIDLQTMYESIDDSIAMVQVVNPNNPTGLLMDPVALRAFCKKASAKATVLVDEAYNELTDMPQENTMVPLVKEGYDVIVARTFSKIYGLAGMRVGYIIAAPEKIEAMSRYGIGWYGLNQAGLAAAVASYEDQVFMDASRAKIREGREMVYAALKENGLSGLPSQTNFIFVDLGSINAQTFREEMAKENVLIRGIYRDYTNWSRVSMGRLEHVQMYVDALPKVLSRLS
ncbi:pyridoxal phosphate-dependent aminotransferase [Congregibacter litoralis]|uniref:Histidinol-phosphate/aromatic aminotransferase and cobyric acid decarboxylase n=1 Tax=Congregibacter litoralis KT71 TaxID=314285 RepID=A4A6B0_9GAMM|nr:histidinol-phosphate transaminase [Congregibacter litoralis]EAQ98557.1 Histidinol-phosphate/aromatic aminotransferase and cobyric acid decarboxylase [Congregibacter litoralis KT71]